MKSKISVIIPTYNRAELLERALTSVMSQTHPPDEIIVIDDGSTDNTGEMVRKNFPAVHYYWQENLGVSSARNQGIQASKHDWLAFLDSDDEWLPKKLEKQMQALHDKSGLEKNPRPPIINNKSSIINHQLPTANLICHTNEVWIRGGKRVNPMKKHAKFGGYIFKECLPLCIISPSSAIIHRSVFDTVGLFDESLPACEDYDLWLRICARYPVCYLEEPLIIKYGGHQDQLSQKHWGMDRFRIQALEKIIHSQQLNPENLQAAIRMILKKLDIFTRGAEKRQKWGDAEPYRVKLEYYREWYHSGRWQ